MGSGARLLPPCCPISAPPGERKFFQLLKEDPGAAGWTALHSLDLADHTQSTQGEADFIVLIPNEGILIIEVKSHQSVLYREGNWWLGGKFYERSPFKQASECLHSVLKYLQQRDLAHSVPIASFVVFTQVSFNFTSPEWNVWQVLDRQALHARPISASLLKAIRSAREFYSGKNLFWMRDGFDASSQKLEMIAKTLRPRFEVLASPSERRKKLEEGLRLCTEQQLRVLDESSLNPRLLVTGLAGTGKTTLATEVVRREKLKDSNTIVGFFCFNRILGKVLSDESSNLGSGIRAGTFHSWMLEFAGMKPTSEHFGNPLFWNRDLPEQCISLLTAPGMQTGYLDLLVLDEAQDLFIDSYLDIFDLLLKGGLKNGRWRFLGDFDRQDIFAFGTIRISDFLQIRVEERCAVQILSENCRNTQEISSALTLYARLNPGYSRVLRGDSRHDPDILFYETTAEQVQLAIELLDKYVAEGFKLSEIVLLSPGGRGCLPDLLRNHQRFKGRLREFSLNPDTVSFTTIQKFKGLEAPVVIITDICSLSKDIDLDLLYIGMSRALHRLSVLCHNSTKQNIQESCLS